MLITPSGSTVLLNDTDPLPRVEIGIYLQIDQVISDQTTGNLSTASVFSTGPFSSLICPSDRGHSDDLPKADDRRCASGTGLRLLFFDYGFLCKTVFEPFLVGQLCSLRPQSVSRLLYVLNEAFERGSGRIGRKESIGIDKSDRDGDGTSGSFLKSNAATFRRSGILTINGKIDLDDFFDKLGMVSPGENPRQSEKNAMESIRRGRENLRNAPALSVDSESIPLDRGSLNRQIVRAWLGLKTSEISE